MDDLNPYAAPQHDLPPLVLASEAGGGYWRDGELLLMRQDAVLPDRCVKCNAPAEGRKVKQSLRWLAPIHVLGYPIPLVERRAKIEIGLCRRHRRNRRLAMAAAWSLFALSLAMFSLSQRGLKRFIRTMRTFSANRCRDGFPNVGFF